MSASLDYDDPVRDSHGRTISPSAEPADTARTIPPHESRSYAGRMHNIVKGAIATLSEEKKELADEIAPLAAKIAAIESRTAEFAAMCPHLFVTSHPSGLGDVCDVCKTVI